MSGRNQIVGGLAVGFALIVGAAAPATATPFAAGDFITHSQDDWGAIPAPGNAAQLLTDQFDPIYGGAGVEVGIAGASGFSMTFSNVTHLITYLPSTGSPNVLNSDHLDPTVTSSGEFGGEVLALRFNADFSDAGLLGSSSVRFGDLILANFGNSAIDGLTIRQALAEGNLALGGASTPLGPDTLDALFFDLDHAFIGGTVSAYAEQHLVLPAATAIPEPPVWVMLIAGLGFFGIAQRRVLRR